MNCIYVILGIHKENFWSVSENQPFSKHVILGGLMSGGRLSGGLKSVGRLSGGRLSYDREATHQLIKSNKPIGCSELILGRGQTNKGMPFCPLPKNHSSKSVKSHASVIACVHLILKKSNKSIPVLNQYLDLFTLI